MSEELISKYVDRQGITDDTKFLIGKLQESLAAFEKLSNLKVGISLTTTTKGIAAELKAINEQNILAVKLSNESAKAAREEAKAREANAKATIATAKASQSNFKAMSQEKKMADDLTNDYKQLSIAYNEAALKAKNYALQLGLNHPIAVQAAKDADQLGTLLKKLDATVGQNQRNVGNYASGFKGLSNSFNQITRELPAFSNSIQTGFLAISNNLPILFDEISRTRAEIIKLRAAGEPTPSLFKAIAGSFFTLGTALSLGVTALTIYGAQIVDFIGSMVKGTKALDEFTERQKILGETLKTGGLKDAVTNVNELRINIDLAKKGFLDKEKVVEQYNKTIGETTGKVSSLDEAEKELVKNGDAYIKMTLYKAAAQLALEKASDKALQFAIDQQKKAKEFLTPVDKGKAIGSIFSQVVTPDFLRGGQTEKDQADQLKYLSDARKKESLKNSKAEEKVFLDIAAQFQADAAKISEGLGFDFFGGGKNKAADKLKTFGKELNQDVLTDYKDSLLEAAKVDELYITQRLNFRKEALEVEKDLINEKAAYDIKKAAEARNEVLSDKGASQNARINAVREYKAKEETILEASNIAIKKAEKQTEQDLVFIKADSIIKQGALDKQLYEELVKANAIKEKEAQRSADAIYAIDNEKLKNKQSAELAALDEEFAKVDRQRKDFPKIERKYNMDRLAVQEEYQIKSLESQIEFAEKQLAIEKAKAIGSGDEEALQRIEYAETKLNGLRINLTSILAAFKIRKSKEATDATKKDTQDQLAELEKLKEAAFGVADIIGSFVSIKNEKEKNALQEQIDLLEKKKQAEIEGINATTASSEEKAAKIKIIEARAAAQREQLEIKQRQAEQRNARFQKSISVAKAIADTALAVIKAYTEGDPYTKTARAIIAAAVGAAQVAAIIATPIPKYRMGTGNHPGGPAVVGDGGKRELVITPSGQMMVTPDKDTVMDIPAGSMVMPDFDLLGRVGMVNAERLSSLVTASKHRDHGEAAATSSLQGELRDIKHAIVNKRETHFHWDNGELKTSIKNGESWTRYINDHVKR